ncbi:MAG: energy transducer TonB [Phaeodactylibacter sp.]|nr:energy transducer TonB [Phaeodactylibacter sp.]
MLLIVNRLKPFVYTLLTLAMVSLTFTANAQDKKKDKDYIRVTEKGTTYELVGMESNVVYNPYTFTWFAWEEPVYKKEKKMVSKLIPVSAFERPPVFSGECLIAKDQYECSNRMVRKYAKENYFEYPDEAQNQLQEGLEYVTFTLDKNGNFKGNLRVISKDPNNRCEGCADAAANLVASMEDEWYPAIKDGEAVETQLTIPVRFELLNQ